MSRQGLARERTYANILEFWESEAAELGKSPEVTIRDHYFRIHELHTLQTLIPRSKALLDIGCGTGFGTVMFSRRAARTTGGDYSGVMIQWAQRLVADQAYRTALADQLSPLWPLGGSDVQFCVANIVDLDLPGAPFDVITGQRILINLPNHDEQMKALDNLQRVAEPRATLILTEAVLQGHRDTDRFRDRFGVPALEKYWHNNYVDEDRYGDWIAHGWEVTNLLSFDTYALLSKVVYPAALGQENCSYLSGANEAAMEVANLFRTLPAARELGDDIALLDFYAERVRRYDPSEADAIGRWAAENGSALGDWSRLGHQRLIVARAV